MSSVTSYRLGPDDLDRDGSPPGPPPARRRSRRAFIALGAVTVLAVGGTWAVAFSPLLGVGTVRVDGVHVVSAAQVRTAADIVENTPLVRLDTAGVLRRVEALPGIASAKVDTHFPSTVVITVRERTPVGYVRTSRGARLVDRTGRQYRTVTAVPARLPRFVVPSGVSATTTGGAVATVASALPASVLRRVDSVQALDPQSITLLMHSGRIVHWGDASRSAAKARVLAALLTRSSQVIDVSNPDIPFTR